MDRGIGLFTVMFASVVLASTLSAPPAMAEGAGRQIPASADTRDVKGDEERTEMPGEGKGSSIMDSGKEAQALSVEEVWLQDTEPAVPGALQGIAATADSSAPGQGELPVKTEDAVSPGKTEAAGVKRSDPDYLEPLFVRELTGIQKGRNDSNPVWSPSGERLAFERSVKEKKEIVIAGSDGSILRRIYMQQAGGEGALDFFLPGFLEGISYNSGISWSPAGDRFVFMSNGGTGNYDLYLSGLEEDSSIRLTSSSEKDGHARWSPVDERIVFVSGRSGKADLYLLDLTIWETKPLTRGEKTYLYPEWSPDGTRIATIYGSNENHDIFIIDDIDDPFETIRPITTWSYDDLRPTWSPDGRHVAFYSNYNEQNDPKAWCLVVVPTDGSNRVGGEGPSLRIVARNVNPDMERGPAWMPDSRRIVYVEDNRHEFFPIRVVDIDDGSNVPLHTNTRINHDVACSINGTLAFRAQVEQWDHIFLAGIEGPEL